MKQLLFLLFLFLPYLLPAQDADRLNTLLDEWEKENRYMGEVMITKGDSITLHRYVGYKNVEKNIRHDSTSIFAIGSISKTFTAIMILKAVEQNKLSLDSTVDEFLPELPNSSQMSIRHLLRHQTGLRNNTEDLMVRRFIPVGAPLPKLIEPLYKMETDHLPGEQYQYSNSNYVILSHVLESIYKKPYQLILEEQITTPLDLSNTFLTTVDLTKLRSKSSGHYRNQKVMLLSSSVHPLFASGAGGINSTATDINKLAKALFKDGFLPEYLLEEMTDTSGEGSYGMGIYRSEILGKASIGHNGAINGFHTDWLYLPEEDITMIFLMNRENFDLFITVQELVATYYGIPVPASPYKVDPILLEDIKGSYALSPTFKIHIYEDEDILYSRATNQGENALIPQDGMDFKVSGVDARVVFVEEGGVVTHLILEQNGLEQKGIKESIDTSLYK